MKQTLFSLILFLSAAAGCASPGPRQASLPEGFDGFITYQLTVQSEEGAFVRRFKAGRHPYTASIWCWELDPLFRPIGSGRCDNLQFQAILLTDPLLANGQEPKVSFTASQPEAAP